MLDVLLSIFVSHVLAFTSDPGGPLPTAHPCPQPPLPPNWFPYVIGSLFPISAVLLTAAAYFYLQGTPKRNPLLWVFLTNLIMFGVALNFLSIGIHSSWIRRHEESAMMLFFGAAILVTTVVFKYVVEKATSQSLSIVKPFVLSSVSLGATFALQVMIARSGLFLTGCI